MAVFLPIKKLYVVRQILCFLIKIIRKNMKKQTAYSPKNVVMLVTLFVAIFWLLYGLGSFLHESKKIRDEINLIRKQNEENLEKIEEKKQYLEYLKTPQRIEKEAKMQMGKKRPMENVLILIEEKLDVLPREDLTITMQPKIENAKIIDKWQWIFLRRK